jgi:outer membrane lipoprotein carrier protein
MKFMKLFLGGMFCSLRPFLFLFVGLSVFCLLSPALCHAESPEDTARRLQQKYDQIRSLSFHFSQKTEGELSGRAQQGSGTACFVKGKKGGNPAEAKGRMRWDYVAPEKQILVSDGVDFSMYFANLHQMIVSPAKTMTADITYSFFTGTGNLLKDFTIAEPNPEFIAKKEETGKLAVIKLIPREDQSQVSEIHLWVTPDSMIQRIDILDHFDTRTTLELSELAINTLDANDRKAMDALFSFTPPEGTEIIYQ